MKVHNQRCGLAPVVRWRNMQYEGAAKAVDLHRLLRVPVRARGQGAIDRLHTGVVPGTIRGRSGFAATVTRRGRLVVGDGIQIGARASGLHAYDGKDDCQ